jgi:hypothetical protein
MQIFINIKITFHRYIESVWAFYLQGITRPAWAGFKTAEEGIAIIKSCIL